MARAFYRLDFPVPSSVPNSLNMAKILSLLVCHYGYYAAEGC